MAVRRPIGALFVSTLLGASGTSWGVAPPWPSNCASCPAGSHAAAGPRQPASGLPRAAAAASGATSSGWVSVWVHLDMPELANGHDRSAARDTRLRQMAIQQDAVMARLRELGAIEQARVRWVRHALAVRMPCTALVAAAAIPGVKSVRPVRHVDRDPGKGTP